MLRIAGRIFAETSGSICCPRRPSSCATALCRELPGEFSPISPHPFAGRLSGRRIVGSESGSATPDKRAASGRSERGWSLRNRIVREKSQFLLTMVARSARGISLRSDGRFNMGVALRKTQFELFVTTANDILLRGPLPIALGSLQNSKGSIETK